MSGGYFFNIFNIFIPGDTLFTVFFLLLARKLDMGYLGVCRHSISDIRTAMSWLWFVAGGFLCWSLVFWGTMLRADETFQRWALWEFWSQGGGVPDFCWNNLGPKPFSKYKLVHPLLLWDNDLVP